MSKTTKTKPGIEIMRKAFNLHNSVISIRFEEKHDSLTFKFWDKNNVNPSGRGVDCFEMFKSRNDIGAFDEFADRCIAGFNSMSMTDAQIYAKAEDFYSSVIQFFQKQVRFQRFLLQSQIKAKKGLHAMVNRKKTALHSVNNRCFI